MTKAELRDHALRQMGVIGAAEQASAEDAELMETIIDNCQSELEQLEIALWSEDDIPAYICESFSLYCRASCTAWGQDYDPRLKGMALAQIRTVTGDRRSSVGRANYF
jgi:hypothetical protein